MGTRRGMGLWLLLGILPATLAAANLVFVFHGAASTASIYDADSMSLLGTPTVGTGATRGFAAPDLSNPAQFLKLYVVATNTIVVLNPTAPFTVRATLNLPAIVPSSPNSAVLTADGRYLLVAAGGQVHIVNTQDATDAISAQISIGSSAFGIAVAPNSRRAYVASSDSSIIRIIDLTVNPPQLLSLTITLPSGAQPTAIGMAPNGSKLYVTSPSAVHEIDRVQNSVGSPFANIFFNPTSIVFDPDPPVGFAVLNAGGNAPILNLPARSATLNPLSSGSLTVKEVVLPGGNRVFLLAGTPGRLFQGFLSAGGATSELINPVTSLPYGGNAVDVEASPDGRFLFVAFQAESRLVRLDPVGEITLGQVTTSLPPTAISLAFAPATQSTRFDLYGGNNQTSPANVVFSSPLAVRVRSSNSQPAVNQTVTFTSSTTGVTFSDSTATSNLNGVAETFVSSPVTTPVTVLATVFSGTFTSSVTFTLNGTGSTPSADGLFKVSGDRQMVSSSTTLPLPLVVRATNSGLPVPSLTLSISASSILTCGSSVITDLNGQGSITCIAGVTGTSTIAEVNVTDAFGRALTEPFRITVVPSSTDLPTGLTIESESLLNVSVRQSIPDGIRVRAIKTDGSGVEGAGIAFSSPQDVTFTPSTAVTNAGGGATTTVTFGCFAGLGLIRAILLVPGTPTSIINFNASRGAPAQILKRQGDNQSGPPGRRLDGPGQALRVQLTDACGNGIPDQIVGWSVTPSDAATLENVFGRTDFEGQSSVLVRLGSRPGPFTVTASSGGFNATFTITVTVVATRVVAISGNNQNVALGQQAAQPLIVETQDSSGSPASGVEVNFRVTGGSATLSASRVISDAQGRASTRVTAGSTLGTITVVAEAVSTSVTFTLNTLGRVPAAPSIGFVNGASFRLGWVPGGIGSIFGTGLMEGVSGVVLADRAPFPTSLRGVRVIAEGTDCPIISMANISGQEQINVLVPTNLPSTGTISVVLQNNGSSATVTGVRMFAVQPGIFELALAGGRFAAALHTDFSIVTPSNPARRGETILLFLTGLGATTPAVPTNTPGPIPPATTVVQPVVGINDAGVPMLGSFLAPTLFGTYQINFTVPNDARSGNGKLSVVAAGVASQDSLLPIQ